MLAYDQPINRSKPDAGQKPARAAADFSVSQLARLLWRRKTAIAMAGLFVRAIATGELTGALFLVGFTALFAWQVGGFVGRNRPQAYTFERLPRALLP